KTMIMANGSPSLFEWQFDDYDDGFDVTAVDDEPLDFESVFNSVGEQSEGTKEMESLIYGLNLEFERISTLNPLADLPSSTEPCNESASHGANEHSETQNSSLEFLFQHHSEASTSMAYYQDGSFDTADWPMSAPARVGTDFELFHYSEASTSMSVPDFSSFYNHGTVGTNFERANINDTFGFTNGSYGNHQLKDTTGIIDGMLYDSVRNSHQALEILGDEKSPPSSSLSAIETKDKEIETLCLDEDEHINPSVQTTSSQSAGTLVVCPTSVLRQWNEELQNKVISDANLSVLITKDPIELAKYDVVITTYAIVSMEVPKQPLDEDEDEEKIKISPTKKRKYPPTESTVCPLAKLRWFRVILDEAQSIKNYKTQVARACWGLRAKRRWCLSGTPIQNSIDDLFLKYDPFAVYKKFCTQIKAPIQRNPAAGYKKLQLILQTIMLRRTKGTLLKGEPIISLPPKTIILKKVDFSAEERGFYRSLEAEARAQFEEYAAAGTVKQNYVNILLMLLRLRQACDHRLLVRGCRSSTDWRLSVEKAKQFPQEKLRCLLNCLEGSLAICSICNDPPENAVVTTCEHVFCNQCILEHLSSDDSQCPSSECKKLLTRSSVFCKTTLKDSISGHDSVESEVMGPCSSSEPVDSLKIEASKALDSAKIRAAIEVLQSIAKPKEMTLNDTKIEGDSVVREKAIVFSQWTGMLDLLEVCLKDSSIGYRRLDGTMSVVARDKAVKDFNKLPEVTVIIMSLKAASLGLNMVAACHVILLDLWWNPTIEDQAIDRAHRIGQTRPVTVLRFAVKDTIEDRILALQKKKRKMVASAFGDDKNGSMQTRLTFADMKYLFQV
ncbi:hypothetical protein M8C21_007547, partial [Ambrosia artemisiifolia]